ncbi:MAG: FecR domain-containing protein, partial [Nitrospirae bacterium]
MNTRSPYMVLVVVTLSMVTSLVWAQGGSDEGIGLFTAVQGAVTVMHPHLAKALPVNLHDEVLFKDVIQTRTESRTKAFFDDDSILTVGEKSHVEITEHIYDPDRNLRRMVVKLAQGRLRALVAKVFNGPGSAFEI